MRIPLAGSEAQVATIWWPLPNTTGGQPDGLSIRPLRGALPTTRTVHSLACQAGVRRCSVRHVHLAAAGHHLLPLCDPDLCASLHARRRADRLGLVVGDCRRTVGHWPVGGQLHPAQSDPRDGVDTLSAVRGIEATRYRCKLLPKMVHLTHAPVLSSCDD